MLFSGGRHVFTLLPTLFCKKQKRQKQAKLGVKTGQLECDRQKVPNHLPSFATSPNAFCQLFTRWINLKALGNIPSALPFTTAK